MKRKFGLAVLGALMAITGLTAFGTGTVVGPSTLQAQGCGAFAGPMCAANCTRECSSGGCCAWSFYYYSGPETET
jgi:hypothetical protein